MTNKAAQVKFLSPAFRFSPLVYQQMQACRLNKN